MCLLLPLQTRNYSDDFEILVINTMRLIHKKSKKLVPDVYKSSLMFIVS